MPTQPTIVLTTGLPGTGKPTMAEVAAHELDAGQPVAQVAARLARALHAA